MLKSEGKISDMLIDNLMNWRHSGFNVYCGSTLCPVTRRAWKIFPAYLSRIPLTGAHDLYSWCQLIQKIYEVDPLNIRLIISNKGWVGRRRVPVLYLGASAH